MIHTIKKFVADSIVNSVEDLFLYRNFYISFNRGGETDEGL